MTSTEYKVIEVAKLKAIFGEGDYLTAQYDPADLYFVRADKPTIIGEYKTRNCRIDSYRDGYVMEFKKLKALKEKAKNEREVFGRDVKLLYINYFTESGMALIWDLELMEKKKQFGTEKGWFKTKTASDFKGAGEKSYREVLLLKPEYAIRRLTV